MNYKDKPLYKFIKDELEYQATVLDSKDIEITDDMVDEIIENDYVWDVFNEALRDVINKKIEETNEQETDIKNA